MKRGEHQETGAVIVAAGESRRMGGVDKVLALLDGRAVLSRVIDAFQECHSIDRIVVVLGERNLEKGKRLVTDQGWAKVAAVCPGGERRQDSVLNGLEHLAGCKWIVIHDGARPMVTRALIEDGLEAAMETGAAVAAVPVTDTIKVVGDDRFVRETLPRTGLFAAQTPQVFRYNIIAEAYRQLKGEFTDDASMVEKLGYRVKLYPGSYHNIKITSPDDLVLAEWILCRRKELSL